MIIEHESFKEIRNPFTGELIMTAEEHYQNYLEQKQIDICPTPTTEEKVEVLINQVTVMDKIIASLTLEVL